MSCIRVMPLGASELELLETADAQTARTSVKAVQGLASVEPCADPDVAADTTDLMLTEVRYL